MVAPMKIDTYAKTTEVLTRQWYSTNKQMSILWNQLNTWMFNFMGLTYTCNITLLVINDDQIVLSQQSSPKGVIINSQLNK